MEAAKPRRIVLFGSAARGKMKRNSDIDILVVVEDGSHRRKTAHAIYRSLFGVGFATDVIVVTESDIEAHRGSIGSIVQPALDEGIVVYDAA